MITDNTFTYPCCEYMKRMDASAEGVSTEYNGTRIHTYHSAEDGRTYTVRYEYCPFCMHRYSYDPSEEGVAYLVMDCSVDCDELMEYMDAALPSEGQGTEWYRIGNEVRIKGLTLDEYKMFLMFMQEKTRELHDRYIQDSNHQGTCAVDGIACWNPKNGRFIGGNLP